MNDEEFSSTHETQAPAKTDDLLPEALAEAGTEGTELQAETTEATSPSAISDDPLPDPDPAASQPDQTVAEDRLESLRGELNQLRAELAERDLLLSRIGRDCEEFHVLYPDTPLSDLPDRIWSDVRQGIPIAAAYALYERQRAVTQQKASLSNRANEMRSSGEVRSTEADYFSPAEVRAMSQDEVRANYQKIMRSMQKWR